MCKTTTSPQEVYGCGLIKMTKLTFTHPTNIPCVWASFWAQK